jgi:hypothetical protein
MLHWAPKDIIEKESTKEMVGELNRSLVQLLGRNVIIIMIMMKMNNYV